MTPSEWKRSVSASDLLRYAAPRVPRQLLVLAAVACARTAQKQLDAGTRGPALEALRVVTAWVWGSADRREVRAAAAAADAAAYAAAAAAAAAAYAAAYAAAAAAYAAADAAAYAAAAAQKQMAGLVRDLIPYELLGRGDLEWPGQQQRINPSRWFDARQFVPGLMVEVPVQDGLELVVFRNETGDAVAVRTAKQVLGAKQVDSNVLVAMDAAMESF